MAGKPKRFIDPPTEAHKKVARALVQDGKSFAEALEAGGFSGKQARKGAKLLASRPVLKKAILDEFAKLEKKHGPAIRNPKLRERAVLTRLMDNVVMGRDKAVQSCKVLGQHRDSQMWAPESMTGVLIIEAPRSLPRLPDKYYIEGAPSPIDSDRIRWLESNISQARDCRAQWVKQMKEELKQLQAGKIIDGAGYDFSPKGAKA